MTTLTLHHGEAQAEFVEHPIETARKALIRAAEIEPDCDWRRIMRQFADSLPPREAVARGGAG